MLTIIESPLFRKLWRNYWARSGMGERGGVRVIYSARLTSGSVVLLTIYAKGVNDNIPAHILRKLAEELGHDG